MCWWISELHLVEYKLEHAEADNFGKLFYVVNLEKPTFKVSHVYIVLFFLLQRTNS